jgi:hypothetical protein
MDIRGTGFDRGSGFQLFAEDRAFFKNKNGEEFMKDAE